MALKARVLSSPSFSSLSLFIIFKKFEAFGFEAFKRSPLLVDSFLSGYLVGKVDDTYWTCLSSAGELIELVKMMLCCLEENVFLERTFSLFFCSIKGWNLSYFFALLSLSCIKSTLTKGLTFSPF